MFEIFSGWKLMIIFLNTIRYSYANWLYLGLITISTPGPTQRDLSALDTYHGAPSECTDLHRMNVLDEHQLRVCIENFHAMPAVSRGIRQALIECRTQFRYERWNCTTAPTANDSETDILASTLRNYNQETAFLQAVTTAGLVFEVTRACSAGNLTDCSCDMSTMHNYGAGEYDHMNGDSQKWRWGGCSDNIRYGIRFTKMYLDAAHKENLEHSKSAEHLMSMHNNEAGRQAIARNLDVACRCHGVSGSCEFKTCWRAMGKFNKIGAFLKNRYDHAAIQIARRAKRKLRRKVKHERQIPIRSDQIVYMNKSPNYCVQDEHQGILGTTGRECNRTSLESDSCDLLCCGRGYNTREDRLEERCACKFVWCCYVKCKQCNSTQEIHTCK